MTRYVVEVTTTTAVTVTASDPEAAGRIACRQVRGYGKRVAKVTEAIPITHPPRPHPWGEDEPDTIGVNWR